GGADHRQRDAGVARGALDDGAAGGQRTGPLGGVDDGDAHPVLDGVGGVVELQLGQDRGLEALGEAVETHERGAADECGDVVVDTCHGGSFTRGVGGAGATDVGGGRSA